MSQDPPPQRPEGKLLYDMLEASDYSIRQAASQAGMSDARWRQIVKGSMQVQGTVAEVVAPPLTLAKMARVLGITPEQLVDAGREDAAVVLKKLGTLQPGDTVSYIGEDDDDEYVTVRGRFGRTSFVSAKRPKRNNRDEIDLIYESEMSAREKLLRIRQVLELRAQAAAEEAQSRRKPAGTSGEEAEQSVRRPS